MSVAEFHPASSAGQASDAEGLTRRLAAWVAGLEYDALSEGSRIWTTHALLDWCGVTLAAARAPLVDMLADELLEGSRGDVTLIGRGQRADKHAAALINGAASHVFDYDDVAEAMHGHPTAPVAPAILALGEEIGASGQDIITAFVAGVQIECRLGAMTDSRNSAVSSHYERGFHATGTIGAFGAAAAAARLMRLDAEATARALGLAATQGAGLKCNFGTMTKPFHAGKAAASGLLAARLAARGFTANPDAIEAPQGFVFAQVPEFTPLDPEPGPDGVFEVERTLFKYHAACYSTHATLNALRDVREAHGIGCDDVDRVTLFVNTRHANNCNKPDPRTGLDLKFSIRHLTAMGLDGADTGALETYSQENALDPRYVDFRERVDVVFQPERNRMTTQVRLALKDGRVIEKDSDSGQPATDLARQWQQLSAKFRSLAFPVIGEERSEEALAAVGDLAQAEDIRSLMRTMA